MKSILVLVTLGVGIWLVFDYSNWQTFLGVFLMIWANNIEREW